MKLKKNTTLERLRQAPVSPEGDTTGWHERHSQAMRMTREGHERALFRMLEGWLMYADAHRTAYAEGEGSVPGTMAIGQDSVLGDPWIEIGKSLLALLNGQIGRFDGGTLDGIIREALLGAGADL